MYKSRNIKRICIFCFVFISLRLTAQQDKKSTILIEPGQTMIPFKLPMNNGDTIDSKDLKGKVVLLDFWYIGCYWCKVAQPYIEKLDSVFSSLGLYTLGINPKQTDTAKINGYMRKYVINHPTVFNTKGLQNLYGVKGYPVFILIGKDQKIYSVYHGFSESAMDELRHDLGELLK